MQALQDFPWVLSFPVNGMKLSPPHEEHDGHSERLCISLAAAGSANNHRAGQLSNPCENPSVLHFMWALLWALLWAMRRLDPRRLGLAARPPFRL